MHRCFLEQLLGVRTSVANEVVFAEFGRLPLQLHILQQILRYHHRIVALDNTDFVKLAMVSGCSLGADQSVTAETNRSWPCHAGTYRACDVQQLSHKFDVASVTEREQQVFKYFQYDNHSSLELNRTSQPEYSYAQYISEVKCWSNRRLLSMFGSGCHGLRVDTRRWKDNPHFDRKDKLCLVCRSTQAEDVKDEHSLSA